MCRTLDGSRVERRPRRALDCEKAPVWDPTISRHIRGLPRRSASKSRADLQLTDIDVAAVRKQQAMGAIEAFRRLGKGRHRAALNIGDCFSYALAKSASQPLLFKGRDFAQTDIEPAIRPERDSYSAVSTKSVKASPASQPNPSSSGESADHIAAVRRLPLSGA